MKHGFWDEYAYRDSGLHRLDARLKLPAVVGSILAFVSTPAPAFWAFAAYAAGVVLLVWWSRLPVAAVARRLLIVVPFILMVAAFAPFLATDQPSGGYSLGIGGAHQTSTALVVWNVTAKALLSTALAVLLTMTTPFPALLQGLRRLRVPDVLVMLLSFAYRYLFVLVDEFHKMRLAREARGFRGRWLWQAQTVGHMIGSLFLRTYERAERVYLAMISRGYTGRFAYLAASPLRWREATLVAGFLIAVVTARVALA